MGHLAACTTAQCALTASDEPGTGCGTEAGPETGPGPHAAAFNEADSHRSFLEALNEWRSGLKAAQPSPAAPAADAQPLGTSNTTSRPGSSSQGRSCTLVSHGISVSDFPGAQACTQASAPLSLTRAST
ncbi:predicted protein [Haematococcus lacustris]|uniref:Uncharacterized protein n=1 Tax=Haematococcus lacustris TaxID=44745 RepID=A0A699YBW2_HAELA|nr:predicted protein [Haematococcus lacustris]